MIDKVVKFASSYFGIEENDIYSNSRKGKVCLVKHICWYYLHRDMRISISKLSSHFNRKVWMIFYGIRKIEGWLCYDSTFRKKYFDFKEELEKGIDE